MGSWIRVGLLGVLLWFPVAGAVRANIFGEDERNPARLSGVLQGRVGAVFTVRYVGGRRSHDHCTGFLVGARKVLTAAHCLEGKWVSSTFRAVSPSGVASGEMIRAESMEGRFKQTPVILDSGERAVEVVRSQEWSEDWAVLELVQEPQVKNWVEITPASVEEMETLVKKDEDDADVSGDLWALGFPVDLQNGSAVFRPQLFEQKGCRVRGLRLPVIYMDCDIWDGQSGAPVFAWIHEQLKWVGMVFGSTEPMGRGPTRGGRFSDQHQNLALRVIDAH